MPSAWTPDDIAGDQRMNSSEKRRRRLKRSSARQSHISSLDLSEGLRDVGVFLASSPCKLSLSCLIEEPKNDQPLGLEAFVDMISIDEESAITCASAIASQQESVLNYFAENTQKTQYVIVEVPKHILVETIVEKVIEVEKIVEVNVMTETKAEERLFEAEKVELDVRKGAGLEQGRLMELFEAFRVFDRECCQKGLEDLACQTELAGPTTLAYQTVGACSCCGLVDVARQTEVDGRGGAGMEQGCGTLSSLLCRRCCSAIGPDASFCSHCGYAVGCLDRLYSPEDIEKYGEKLREAINEHDWMTLLLRDEEAAGEYGVVDYDHDEQIEGLSEEGIEEYYMQVAEEYAEECGAFEQHHDENEEIDEVGEYYMQVAEEYGALEQQDDENAEIDERGEYYLQLAEEYGAFEQG